MYIADAMKSRSRSQTQKVKGSKASPRRVEDCMAIMTRYRKAYIAGNISSCPPDAFFFTPRFAHYYIFTANRHTLLKNLINSFLNPYDRVIEQYKKIKKISSTKAVFKPAQVVTYLLDTNIEYNTRLAVVGCSQSTSCSVWICKSDQLSLHACDVTAVDACLKEYFTVPLLRAYQSAPLQPYHEQQMEIYLADNNIEAPLPKTKASAGLRRRDTKRNFFGADRITFQYTIEEDPELQAIRASAALQYQNGQDSDSGDEEHCKQQMKRDQADGQAKRLEKYNRIPRKDYGRSRTDLKIVQNLGSIHHLLHRHYDMPGQELTQLAIDELRRYGMDALRLMKLCFGPSDPYRDDLVRCGSLPNAHIR